MRVPLDGCVGEGFHGVYEHGVRANVRQGQGERVGRGSPGGTTVFGSRGKGGRGKRNGVQRETRGVVVQ